MTNEVETKKQIVITEGTPEYEAFCFVIDDYKRLIEIQKDYPMVPDWDTRLKATKIIISFMSKEQKDEILNGLLSRGYTSNKILTLLGDCLNNCKKPKSFDIRSEAQRKRWKILKRDKFTCQYCGRKSPDVVLHVDHKIPISKGGDSSDGNLTTSCMECNLGKFVDIL